MRYYVTIDYNRPMAALYAPALPGSAGPCAGQDPGPGGPKRFFNFVLDENTVFAKVLYKWINPYLIPARPEPMNNPLNYYKPAGRLGTSCRIIYLGTRYIRFYILSVVSSLSNKINHTRSFFFPQVFFSFPVL